MKEAEDPTATLNELGADGWELATTIDYVGGGTKLLVFKRPLQAPLDGEVETDGRFEGEGVGPNHGVDSIAERDRCGGGT